MRNYETLIMEQLQGDTPKEKYEYLQDLKTKSVVNDNGEVMFISVADHKDLMSEIRTRIIEELEWMKPQISSRKREQWERKIMIQSIERIKNIK